MRNQKIFYLAGLFVLIAQMSAHAETVVIYPDEYPYALRNPLMGFRCGSYQDPYAAVTHCYIRWNELENDESDTIDKIKTVCNDKWRDMERYNVKVIPRVFLNWDGNPGNEYWPADMDPNDYTSEQFKTRLRRLIQRLGQCWNNDPRVAWVQMGIIGAWGEHHSPGPTPDVEQLMGEEFNAAFPNKKVLVRHPWGQFTAYPFGGYWDSWAHWNQKDHGAAIDGLNNSTQRWKVNVFEGECAYNWGQWAIQPGQDPNDTVSDPVHRNYLIDSIRDLHCSALGWVSGYTKTIPEIAAGAEEIQRAFGYRYLLNEVTYPGTLTPGAEFSVQFKVTNVGSAPFYHNWPVEISLLNKTTKALVWHDTFDGCDIRKWLPGDQYNFTTRTYSIAAVANTVSETFQLPTGIANGEYILALAILDPAGMLPSVRFSTKNYFNGGRHPIGYTGVNVTPSQTQLSSSLFNDPAADRSLFYSLTRILPLAPAGIDIQAENYTAMGGVQRENTTDAGGGQNIGYIDNGDWAQYSITIPAAGSYPVDFRVASATSGGTINMVVGSSTVGSVAVTGTGGWQNWTTVRTTATFSTAGPQTLRLNFVGSGNPYNINWFKVITNLDTTAPAVPTGLDAAAGNRCVWLDWADSADASLWGYGVYRSQTAGGPYTHVRDVFTSDWKDSNVIPGGTYYYVVTAMDLYGNESGYSSQDSVIPDPDLLIPNPAEFNEYPAALSDISISMSAVPGTASAGPVEYLFTEAGGNISGWQLSPDYIAVNLQPATAYTYTVKMRDSMGNQTAPSAPFSAFTHGDPDIVKNYIVDIGDLAALAARWLESDCYLSGLCGGADLNADGSVGLKDFQMLAVLWLTDVTPLGFKESGGLVCMEAEHYDALEQRNEPATWVKVSSPSGHVGEGYMWTVDGVYSNTPSYDQGTRMLYSIVFSSTGTFNVYVRRYCDPNGSNSAWAGLDDVVSGTNDNTGDYDQWIWKSLGTVTVSTPGVKTLDIVRREQGYKIDRIVLTKGAIPTGTGPAESPR